MPQQNEKNYLIDTHAHLHFPDFKDQIDEVVSRAEQGGVKKIINIGTCLQDSKDSINIASEHENIFASVGVHPCNAKNLDLAELEEFAKNKKCKAIGEIGLDYFRMKNSKEIQKKSLEKQLDLALRLSLPVIIHSRDASKDMLSILKNFSNLQGVFHCFSGGKKTAKKVLDLGFFISFTGIATFPNAQNMRNVIKEVPLEKIMIETDCPFLSPQKFRGQRNEPLYVIEVAKTVSEIKEVSFEKVAGITTKNAETLFQI